jgi:hypothetical protein
VELKDAGLRLPDSKTGAKVVHFGQAAVDVLCSIERQPFNPFVVAGSLPGKPLSDLQPFWQRSVAGRGSRTCAFMTCGIRSRRSPQQQAEACQ